MPAAAACNTLSKLRVQAVQGVTAAFPCAARLDGRGDRWCVLSQRTFHIPQACPDRGEWPTERVACSTVWTRRSRWPGWGREGRVRLGTALPHTVPSLIATTKRAQSTWAAHSAIPRAHLRPPAPVPAR